MYYTNIVRGVSVVNIVNGVGTLRHNAGFAGTNYTLLFTARNEVLVPARTVNVDGNNTTIVALGATQSGDAYKITNPTLSANIAWIALLK